jgi:hypothetical protein
MIFGVLVVIWVIALTPFFFRRLTEHQFASSMSRFHSATRVLRHFSPRPAVTSLSVLGSVTSSVDHHSAPRSAPSLRRRELERAQRQIARRRQLLGRLVGVTFTTLVFGCLPHLHVLWDLSIVAALLTGAYVVVLVHLARSPALSPPQRRMAQTFPVEPKERPYERLAASGGGTPFTVPQMPRRPAFVLLEPHS